MSLTDEQCAAIRERVSREAGSHGATMYCDALIRAGYAAARASAQDAAQPVAECRGYARLGIGAYLINHSRAGEPPELVISLATEAEKAGRVIGDERDNEPDSVVLPEDMVVRIGFENEAGLRALERQIELLRAVHFWPHPDDRYFGFPPQDAAAPPAAPVEPHITETACQRNDGDGKHDWEPRTPRHLQCRWCHAVCPVVPCEHKSYSGAPSRDGMCEMDVRCDDCGEPVPRQECRNRDACAWPKCTCPVVVDKLPESQGSPVDKMANSQGHAAPVAPPAPDAELPKCAATAPPNIWLQIGDDRYSMDEPFPDDHEGITWCQDSVLACEVKYVRADRLIDDASKDRTRAESAERKLAQAMRVVEAIAKAKPHECVEYYQSAALAELDKGQG